ncbi:hypothetical protein [Mesorhizobium sp. M0195]|uniref:hypothetical protein n=1 Tax=Mesorhizobium sp. M0195 TaxID=2956910 RepID=UPI00333D2135
MPKYQHNGWKIQTQMTSAGWHALMWAPGSSLCKSEVAEATIDEGEQMCLARAKNMIEGWENGNA